MLFRWYTHTLLHFKQTMVQVKTKLTMKRFVLDLILAHILDHILDHIPDHIPNPDGRRETSDERQETKGRLS